jgi:putative sterol carrier protein
LDDFAVALPALTPSIDNPGGLTYKAGAPIRRGDVRESKSECGIRRPRRNEEDRKMPDIGGEVKKILDLMSSQFNPDAAKGLDVVIQFNLTGEGGGSYYVQIKDGTCTHSTTTPTEPPKLTTSMSASDFVKLCNREADPETLFNYGKLRLNGDIALAMKMQTLFRRPG